MIRTISLLPLAGGLLSIVLASITLAASSRRNPTVRFFLGLNAGSAAWSLAYFVVLNLDSGDPLLAAFGSPLHLLGVVMILGVAAAPTYWFLFAASYSTDSPWNRPPRLWLAHIPFIFTAVAAVTNPLHHLFVTGTAEGGVAYGPLAPLHHLGTFILIIAGIVLIVGRSWRRGTSAGRRQAMVLGSASLVPLLGGAAWSLRHLLGLPLTVNPTPVLFPVLSVALGLELLRTGLADIVPYATQQAFNAVSDAAIALNGDGCIVALNAAALGVLPGAAPGMTLAAARPELAASAEACLTAADYAGFDVWLGRKLYWGRARPMRDRHGSRNGCVLLLTDVTEVRAPQSCGLEPEAVGR